MEKASKFPIHEDYLENVLEYVEDILASKERDEECKIEKIASNSCKTMQFLLFDAETFKNLKLKRKREQNISYTNNSGQLEAFQKKIMCKLEDIYSKEIELVVLGLYEEIQQALNRISRYIDDTTTENEPPDYVKERFSEIRKALQEVSQSQSIYQWNGFEAVEKALLKLGEIHDYTTADNPYPYRWMFYARDIQERRMADDVYRLSPQYRDLLQGIECNSQSARNIDELLNKLRNVKYAVTNKFNLEMFILYLYTKNRKLWSDEYAPNLRCICERYVQLLEDVKRNAYATDDIMGVLNTLSGAAYINDGCGKEAFNELLNFYDRKIIKLLSYFLPIIEKNKAISALQRLDSSQYDMLKTISYLMDVSYIYNAGIYGKGEKKTQLQSYLDFYGIDKKDLATCLGVAPSTITDMFKVGKSSKYLSQIAQLLNVSESFALGLTSVPSYGKFSMAFLRYEESKKKLAAIDDTDLLEYKKAKMEVQCSKEVYDMSKDNYMLAPIGRHETVVNLALREIELRLRNKITMEKDGWLIDLVVSAIQYSQKSPNLQDADRDVLKNLFKSLKPLLNKFTS